MMFNAHRIYTYEQVVKSFADFTLKQFALVPDNGLKEGLIVDASEQLANQQTYGCGCFWFEKA